AVLRSARAAEALRPEVVVRLGPPGPARVVNEGLAASGAAEVGAGAPGWSDPAGTAAVVVPGAPAALVATRAAAAKRGGRPLDGGGCLARWQAVAVAAAGALDRARLGRPTGAPGSDPAAARAPGRARPP